MHHEIIDMLQDIKLQEEKSRSFLKTFKVASKIETSPPTLD